MAEPTEPRRPNDLDELDDYAPIKRDYGFAVKMVAALLVGLAVALLIGWKIKSAAAGCGTSLMRPGSTVVPPPQSQAP